MTELTQPLALTKETIQSEAPADATFSELVYAHFDWWNALRGGGSAAREQKGYARARAAFQRRHGELISAYWCSHVESGVALTHKPRRLRWLAPIPHFHRESDWATQNAPEIARELHRCDELTIRARTVLTGVRRLICMQLVFASASHLLSLVDARAAHTDATKTDEALVREREALARAEKYYCEAANGQAQIIYFAGMAVVALAISICAAVWLTVEWASPIAAVAAGALGAVVSVIQRINNGHFQLEYDVGRPYALFLGGLRPLIGGAFALVISFAFTGGFLHLPIADDGHADRRLALLVVAFVAGFSERWAQDTLVGAMPSAKSEEPRQTAGGSQ
jgi:hypothetical protein